VENQTFAYIRFCGNLNVVESISVSNLKEEWKEGNFFHAHLLLGEVDEAESLVNFLCETINIPKNMIIDIRGESANGKSGGIKIEQIRDLVHLVNLTSDKKKIAVIWQAETLNASAANSLLKILEEPPQNVIFLLQARSLSLPLTIKSRCRVVRLKRKNIDTHTSSYKIDFGESIHVFFKQVEGVVKNDEIDIYLEELVFSIRNDMLKYRNPRLVEAVGSILQTKSRISKNANPRLAIENLILFIKDIYDRNIFQG